jgi:hypothetical protein
MSMDRDLLSTYLNDHLGGATGGRDLAKRLVEQNEGTPYGPVLLELYEEIAVDRETLVGLMKKLDIEESKVKVAVGWAGEKLARLKPNDRLTDYSPLSRLFELEGLSGGVQAKLSLWQVLRACAEADPILQQEDFPALEDRAHSQLDRLEKLRIEAGREAFVGQPAQASA